MFKAFLSGRSNLSVFSRPCLVLASPGLAEVVDKLWSIFSYEGTEFYGLAKTLAYSSITLRTVHILAVSLAAHLSLRKGYWCYFSSFIRDWDRIVSLGHMLARMVCFLLRRRAVSDVYAIFFDTFWWSAWTAVDRYRGYVVIVIKLSFTSWTWTLNWFCPFSCLIALSFASYSPLKSVAKSCITSQSSLSSSFIYKMD